MGKIGEGNNGMVHLFEKVKDGKRYAVKIMEMDEEIENFLRKNFFDVRLLRKCPSLVKYYEMFSSQSTKKCYLVMKYYDFPSLDPKAGYPEKVRKN